MASRRKSSTFTLQPVDTNRRFTLSSATPSEHPSRKSLGGLRRTSILQLATPAVRPIASNSGQNRRQSTMPKTPSRVAQPVAKSAVRRTSAIEKGPAPRSNNPKELTQMKLHLQSFLETHGYPHPISQDNLSRPSNAQFHQMFEFLVQQRDPKFVLGEPVEEIPIILRGLGYPFSVTKTVLVTCGAPHTWPNLLKALSWMIELCEYDENSREAEQEALSKHTSFNAFFDFLIRAYDAFLDHGEDAEQIQKMEADIELLIKESCENQNQQIQRKTEQKADYLQEIESLKNSDRRPEFLSHNLELLQRDIFNFQKYIQECKKASEQFDTQHQALLAEEAKKNQELLDISREGETTAVQLQTQALKPGDIEHINLKRTQLTEHLQQIRAKRIMTEDRLFKREYEVSQSWDICQKAFQQYNEMCLRLFPNFKLEDQDLRITIGTIEEPKATDIKKTIKPLLTHFMETLRSIDLQVDEQAIRIKDSVDLIRDQVTEAQYTGKQLEIEKEKLEKQRHAAKAQCDQELGLLYEQIELIQKEKDDIETHTQEMMMMSDQSLQREIEDFKRVEEELKRNHADYFNKVLETLTLIANYKEKVRENLRAYRAHLQGLLETTL